MVVKIHVVVFWVITFISKSVVKTFFWLIGSCLLGLCGMITHTIAG